MSYLPYVIRQGDYLTKLAYLRGFSADEVWEHPKNAAIRSQRQHRDILLPGDVVYLPDDRRPELALETGSSNTYQAKPPTVDVRVVLKELGKPLAGEPYEVRGLPEPLTGTLDGDGGLTIPVPVHINEVRVALTKRREVYPILVGHLDPADDHSGARKRLAHLGYLPRNNPDDIPDDDYRRALTAFQRHHADDHGLNPTGELDDATSAALVAIHGS